MKLLTLLMLGFATYSHAQHTDLKKLWVGEKNNYLSISDSLVHIEHEYYYKNKTGISDRYFRYETIKDTLRIKEELSKETKLHDFIIQELSDKRLTIKAIDSFSSTIIDFNQPRSNAFHFSNRESVHTDSIRFEKLLFHSTRCYGMCPVLTLMLDSSKQVEFIGKQNAVKQGFYTAKLSKKLYHELLQILSISELDKLINTEQAYIDAPAHAMEIYYNGKMKYIRATDFPIMGQLLLEYLNAIPKKLELRASEQPFQINFSTPNAEKDNW